MGSLAIAFKTQKRPIKPLQEQGIFAKTLPTEAIYERF